MLSCGVLCSTGQTRNCPSAENEIANVGRRHKRECGSAVAHPLRHSSTIEQAQESRSTGAPFASSSKSVKQTQACKDETRGRTGQSVRGLQVLVMGLFKSNLLAVP